MLILKNYLLFYSFQLQFAQKTSGKQDFKSEKIAVK